MFYSTPQHRRAKGGRVASGAENYEAQNFNYQRNFWLSQEKYWW